MLATLNLQLSPVELLDDQALTPVSLKPGETGESASGFADLLRLRVDAAQIADDTSGELLPEGGSELPIIAELAPTEPLADLLATADVDAGLVKLAPAPLEIPAEQESLSLPDDHARFVNCRSRDGYDGSDTGLIIQEFVGKAACFVKYHSNFRPLETPAFPRFPATLRANRLPRFA